MLLRMRLRISGRAFAFYRNRSSVCEARSTEPRPEVLRGGAAAKFLYLFFEKK
jgi:hypothetical protein